MGVMVLGQQTGATAIEVLDPIALLQAHPIVLRQVPPIALLREHPIVPPQAHPTGLLQEHPIVRQQVLLHVHQRLHLLWDRAEPGVVEEVIVGAEVAE